MSMLQTMIDIKWPFLLIEVVFLLGGVTLIISGFNIRKKSKTAAAVSIVVGFVLSLVLLWVLFWTLLIGYNS
ncbi:MAG: hypothetical protein L0K82_05865 [Pisciglobus halotolerans]|nr:hypothetical protein [Pisciglobus halotolerans]